MKTMKMIPMLALVLGLVGSTVTYANVDLTTDSYNNWSRSPSSVIAGKAGQDFQVTCRVTNVGTERVPMGLHGGWLHVGFYASSDTTITTSDYLIGEATLFYASGHGLAAGASDDFTFTGSFPTDIPAGTYCIGWIVDPHNSVAESDENNNTGCAKISGMWPQEVHLYVMTPPDLSDGGASYRSFSPASVVAGDSGQSFEVHCRVSNSGQADAGAFTVKFYASTDTTITSSDHYIGEQRLSEVPSGTYRPCDWSGTFPTDIPAGTYYVGWIIDTGSEVEESDENNNTAYKDGLQLTVKTATTNVPNVMGMGEQQAASTITAAGLVARKWYGASPTVQPGYVMAQDPAAGTVVAVGSTVDIDISTGPSGPAPVQVPNVVGLTQAVAQSSITAPGLVVGTVTQAPSNTVAQGRVISQSPPSGTTVAKGSSVNLVISSGPSSGPGAIGKIIWVSDAHQTIADSEVPDDQGWVDLLRSEGYEVDYQPPVSLGAGYWQTLDAVKLAALDAADLIIVSRDTNSASYANDATEVTQWNSIKTPVILLQPYLARSSRWLWINSTTMGARQAYFMAKAVDPLHPVFAGVTFDEDDQVVWLDPAVAPGFSSYINTTNAGTGKIIAVRPDNGFIEIVEWAAGMPFYTDSTLTQTPADKRMLFSAGTEQTLGTNIGYGVYDLTPEGEKMFLNAVAYMLGGAGLVAHWKLDEASGTVAYDSVGEKDGVLYNGPVWQPTSGRIGGSLKFDGVNDYVDLTIGSLIRSLTNSTFATWVNFSNNGGSWQRIFDFGSSDMVYMYLSPLTYTNGPMQFAMALGGWQGGEDLVIAPQTLPGGWHHVAVVIDAANRTYFLYLDGQVVAQKTNVIYLPSHLGNTTQNWLGRSQYVADPYFKGSLDDFRIYNRVLSPAEVAQLAAP